MKNLVRVIRLQPGEAVLIVVEGNHTPDPPGGCVCMVVEEVGKDILFPKGFRMYLDEVA